MMRKKFCKVKKVLVSPWFGAVCMTAGGLSSIEIAAVWAIPFYLEIPSETQGRIEPVSSEETGRASSRWLSRVKEDCPFEKKEPVVFGTSEAEAKGGDAETADHVDLSERRLETDLPDRLNSAGYFEEEDSAEDSSQSVAGRIYQSLSERDSSWIHDLYSLRQISVQDMAARLGAEAPLAKEWTRVNVSFYNGDGIPVSGYSNAKEILSMASVYGYFHQWEDYDAFYQYADRLWGNSHSYTVSVSDFYFCDGDCQYIDSGQESEPSESLSEQGDQERIQGADRDGRGTDETLPENQNLTAPVGAWQEVGPGVESTSSSGSAVEEDESRETGPGVEPSGVAEPEGAERPEGAGESGSGEPSEGGQPGNPGSSEVVAEPERAEQSEVVGEPGRAGQSEVVGEPGSAGQSEVVGEPERAGQSEVVGEPGSAGPSEGGGQRESADQPEDGSRIYEGGAEAVGDGDGTKVCQGHIDLNVSAKIIGLKEAGNLFAADPIGGSADSGVWEGWDLEKQAYARTLEEQDWYALYGLSASAGMYVRNPLTSSEVGFYLNLLPKEISSKRREVVKQALLSVGCIPYYWGGKPYGGGFERNGFGTVTTPDEDGRMLRGLDCSGWINWVYWTALGSSLPAESTSGLINCGYGISKEELQAGDLLIRDGEERHVYMFLAWKEDGSMYLIHETTGTFNNVTINTYDLDVPHYRSLINEE